MDYLYLIMAVFFMASLSIMSAFFNRRVERKNATALYCMVYTAVATVCWAIMFLRDGSYDWGVAPYALIFAVCFTACNAAMVKGIQLGSVVITSLVCQLSLIGVTVWGFLAWNTQVTWLVIIGLILVAVALWLCLYTGKKEPQKKVSLKWIGCLVVLFISNAACTIVQRTQQNQFNGQYGNFFMLLSVIMSLVACIVIYCKQGTAGTGSMLKKAGAFPVAAGICNALLNLLTIVLATSSLSPSLIYPVIAIGGLSLTTVCSAVIFREKMLWQQWIGVLLGMIGVVVLSI